MLNVAITFDYELFLGENFASNSEVLFAPTAKILDILDKYGVKATFFVDVCSAFQHKKFGIYSFTEQFEEQIKNMVSRGHDVQLHIHSNWLYSEYEQGKWEINREKYRLHSLGFEDRSESRADSADAVIANGVKYLTYILQEVRTDYKCVAYRAGGYSIQPHSAPVAVLRKNGIFIDSSVCPHWHINSAINSYDFRKLPHSTNWWLTPRKDFTYEGKVEEGGLFEVPIYTDKNSLFDKLTKPRSELTVSPVKYNGSFIKTDLPLKNTNVIEKLYNYAKAYSLLSFDSMAKERMSGAVLKLAIKHKKDDVYIAAIGHPKLCDDGILENIKAFFELCPASEGLNYVTMTDIYNEVNHDKNI